MESWKIGAIAGLIAGFIGGIITAFIGIPLVFELGLPYWDMSSFSDTSFTKIAVTEILTGLIWGIVSGIVFAWVYGLIPGKGILKGLIYALILYLIFNLRTAALSWHYGNVPNAIAWIIYGLLVWISFGLVLGTLYESLNRRYYTYKEKIKIPKLELKSGIYPGALAGLIGSIAVFFTLAVIFNPEIYQRYAADIDFLISQLGTHAFFNMIWGIVFGVLFVLFYEGIPGKGMLKAIVFSMIIFTLSSFRVSILYLIYISPIWFYMWFISGFLQILIFGIVLGAIYKPPK